MRDQRDDTGPEAGADDGRVCLFCKERKPGTVYDIYAGFCLYERKTRGFLSDTTLFLGEYRDLKRVGVPVCDDCAGRMRLKRHLPWVLGSGAVCLASLVGALAALTILGLGTDGLIALAVAGLFVVLFGAFALVQAWPLLVRPESSPAVTLAVLNKVKTVPKYQKKGDSFFGPEEYRLLFQKGGQSGDADEPLTAEELLARDQATPREPKRRPKPAKAEGASRPCPSCGKAIPRYAQACKHCKTIFQ